jgi:hypothetical protein
MLNLMLVHPFVALIRSLYHYVKAGALLIITNVTFLLISEKIGEQEVR